MLSSGSIVLESRIPWSSNETFLVRVGDDDTDTVFAIYKPLSGEQPLYDFPPGLYKRELAAFLLSEALGWALVPETVVRTDAPNGVGSLQLMIDADLTEHYFTLRDDPKFDFELRRIAVFDMLINNADRKSGHCLRGPDDRLWAIDHGVCFAEDPKLRTVMWDYHGTPIPEELLPDIARVAEHVPETLYEWLTPAEHNALKWRAHAILHDPVFPRPSSNRQYPWPLV